LGNEVREVVAEIGLAAAVVGVVSPSLEGVAARQASWAPGVAGALWVRRPPSFAATFSSSAAEASSIVERLKEEEEEEEDSPGQQPCQHQGLQ
jgi:hypothetical protein